MYSIVFLGSDYNRNLIFALFIEFKSFVFSVQHASLYPHIYYCVMCHNMVIIKLTHAYFLSEKKLQNIVA